MPKVVDHDAQRERFAEATMRLIAQHGLEGVTMRAVAAEAGLSYGSLFHYFESKDELLMHAVRHSMAEQTRRLNEVSSRYAGLEALQRLLCDDAIINESSRDAWMVWMTFQYQVALRPVFAELHAELMEGWLARITGLLEEAQRAGEISAAVDVGVEAVAVWAYSAGVGQMGFLHPESLPADLQKRLLAGYLDKLRGSPSRNSPSA